jgi:multidrug efflux pump
MSIPEFFTLRPIGATLMALGVAIFGVLAFRFLPVAPLPQVEFPTITVSASLPGASPEIMATSVATPLEKHLGQIAGVTEITSTSKLSSVRIVVQFDLNRNINGAARDVQAAIIASRTDLPSNLPSQPNYRIVNPADFPILIIALTSSTYSRGQMYDIASSVLQQTFSQVDGVGQVAVGGGSLPAVRVELNPDKLNQYDISFNQVAQAIRTTNVNQPKGQLKDENHTLEIITNDQMYNAKSFQPVIVSYKNNAPIRLMDIADVIDSVEDIRNSGMVDGKPAAVLVIYKQPGSNVIETVDRLYEALESIKASIPAAIDITVAIDRTETIRASLVRVEITLVLSIFFVILVMYLFLGTARAALVPSVVVPLTILGTFAIMYLSNFSLDNLSLMALTICTGFIVDDAVVVLENIQRHIESGMKPFKAAIEGAKEVSFTVLSMSISLIEVFIPILLMGGIIGRLFREFAFTLSIAIIVSLVVSLTITPMMASKVLKPRIKDVKKHWFTTTQDWMKRHYATSLKWALLRQTLMLFITGGTLLATICLFILIPKGFFPLQDTGRIICRMQTQQDMSFAEVDKKFRAFIKIVQDDPAIKHVAGFAGGPNSVGDSGSLFISLKPRSERDVDVFAVIDRLRKKTSSVTGATLFMQAAQDIIIGGRTGNAQFQYTLSAYELPVLTKWLPRIQGKFSKIPGITDLNNDQLNHGLDVLLTYNRDSLSRFNLTPQEVDRALYRAFGQSQVSTIYTAINQYHVVMEVAPKYWQSPDILKRIFVTNSAGNSIPLSAFAQFAPSSTLLVVTHQSQFPSATLTFNLQSGFSLGDVVGGINSGMTDLDLPVSQIQGKFQGTALAFQQSLSSQPYLILAAILVIYIVLGMLYESMIHPIVILSTLPSAGVGALLALMITGFEFNIIGLIGILLLIGIVKKNAIMMIDFANDIQRTKHIEPDVAIYEACMLRFRPIMMTTMAAICGAIPLAIDSGVGSELRKPLGIAIVGGLIISQVLTLYTTPLIYLSLGKFSVNIKGRWHTFWQKIKSRIKNLGAKNA